MKICCRRHSVAIFFAKRVNLFPNWNVKENHPPIKHGKLAAIHINDQWSLNSPKRKLSRNCFFPNRKVKTMDSVIFYKSQIFHYHLLVNRFFREKDFFPVIKYANPKKMFFVWEKNRNSCYWTMLMKIRWFYRELW